MFDLVQNLVGLQQMIWHMLCRRAPHTTPGATVAFVCWLERSAHRSTVSHSGAARQTVQMFHEQNSLKIQGTCRMPWNAWNQILGKAKRVWFAADNLWF